MEASISFIVLYMIFILAFLSPIQNHAGESKYVCCGLYLSSSGTYISIASSYDSYSRPSASDAAIYKATQIKGDSPFIIISTVLRKRFIFSCLLNSAIFIDFYYW